MRLTSLTSKVIKILIITMVLLLALLLSSSYVFYQKSKHDFVERKENDIKICIQSINEHLNRANSQLIELMLNTIGETDLNNRNDLARLFAKNRLYNAIKNKLSVNSDVDCFFIKNKDAVTVKAYNTQIPSLSRSRIMIYLKENELPETSKTNECHWEVVYLRGEAFFYQAYAMEGYTVGSLIRVSVFNKALNLLIDQDIEGYSYTENDRIICSYSRLPAKDLSEVVHAKKHFSLFNEKVVIKDDITNSNVALISYYKIKVLSLLLNNTYIMLTGIIFIFFTMLLVLKRIISNNIIDPIGKLLSGMQHIVNGKYDYQVMEDAGSIEFNELNKSFNSMMTEIVDLRINKYEQQIKDVERKIKLLRMQIKPHFYLNAITTVRSMTYQDRVEDIRSYLDALSEHIRYMLRVNSSEVRLEEELQHIENYMKMQEIKFPSSVTYYIGCSEELKNKEIEHLLLFTIIENAFKYAMDLYNILVLLIQCEAIEEEGFHGFRVIIEDNGKGFPQEQLDKFRIGNIVEEKQDGKHIGLSNIKKTLELRYERDDLLRLSNIEPHGARVEIWIPDHNNFVSRGDQDESSNY